MRPCNERKTSRWIARPLLFDNETKAYEGSGALLQFDSEGSIRACGYAVGAKNVDGTSTIKQGDDIGTARSVADSSELSRRECDPQNA